MSISVADLGDTIIWIIRGLIRYVPNTIASVTLVPFLSAFKTLIHWYTSKDEITRVAHRRFTTDADRLYAMKCTLAESKALKNLFPINAHTDITKLCEFTYEVKRLDDPKTCIIIQECLSATKSIAILIEMLGQMRDAPFNDNNSQHIALLTKLWNALRPDTVFPGRISNQWDQIGFQGKNPATDFRGNGLLGLRNLVDFCDKYPSLATSICDTYGRDPIKYPGFAICGIRLTSDALQFVKAGVCDRFLFAKGGASMEAFVDLYAILWYRFDRLWKDSKAPDVMSFSSIHSVFVQDMLRTFTDHRAVSQIHADLLQTVNK